MTNRDNTALKDYVDRAFEIERAFADAKGEHSDMIKDLKTEIKSHFDTSGVDFKEVMRLTKIRLEEQAARDKKVELALDLATYDVLYGKSNSEPDPLDD